MLHPTLYLVAETLALLAFIMVVGREIYQKNYLKVWEIVACAIFGMIVEIFDGTVAHGYTYGSGFLVQVWNIPVAIGLGWAVIIYCAMLLSDQYDIPWGFRPLLDALTLLALDLSMDVVAIRIGFWQWPISLNMEWYGVPYDNLVGWIFVVLSFSFLVRLVRTLNINRIGTKILSLLTPILATIALFAQLTLFSLISVIPYGINHWADFIGFNFLPSRSILYDPQVAQWKLIVLVFTVVELVNLVAFSFITNRKHYIWHFDLLSFGILSGAHLFFVGTIFVTGIYRELPIVVPLAIAMLLVHCVLHFLPYLFNPKRIYFFKRLKVATEGREERIEAAIDAAFR